MALRVLVAPSAAGAQPPYADWLAATAAAHPASLSVTVSTKPVDTAMLAALLDFGGAAQQQGELRVVVAGAPSQARDGVLQALAKLGHPDDTVAVVP